MLVLLDVAAVMLVEAMLCAISILPYDAVVGLAAVSTRVQLSFLRHGYVDQRSCQYLYWWPSNGKWVLGFFVANVFIQVLVFLPNQTLGLQDQIQYGLGFAVITEEFFKNGLEGRRPLYKQKSLTSVSLIGSYSIHVS